MNLKNIQDAVKDVGVDTTIKTVRNQNGTSFQVNLSEMGNLSDEEKCRALVNIKDTLVASGIPAENVNVRLSFRDQNNAWRPWPCVWVSSVAATTRGETITRTDVAEIVAAALAQVGLKAMVETKTGKGKGKGKPTPQPAVDDPGVPA